MTSRSVPRKATLSFIFVTVALDMVALGMIAPVLPRLIGHFLQNDTPRTAYVLGVFATIWALMQFLCSPLLGSLSDRFGRRPVILLSNFGLALDYLMMALAPNLSWLFAGRIISGVTAASVPTAMAYIADSTPPERRSSAFGLIGSAFGLGFVLGPAAGGLLGSVNQRLPFWVAGSLSLLNALYGLLVLPESLPKDKRGGFSWLRANPMGSLALFREHRKLIGIAGVLFLGYVANQIFASTYVIYADYRYQWTDRAAGFSLAAVGICSAVTGALLVKPLVHKLGDRTVMLTGLFFGGLGFALLGWSATGVLFCLGIPVINLWGLAVPTAQGMMTHHVQPFEQGQLQGAISSLSGIAGLIGPSMFAAVFAWSIKTGAAVHTPGAAFYLAALLLFGSMIAAVPFTRPSAALAWQATYK